MQLQFVPYQLHFKFDAGTSRGILREKESWMIRLSDQEEWRVGYGECSLLPGLSPESPELVTHELAQLKARIEGRSCHSTQEALTLAGELTAVPAVRFGLETALLDYLNDGQGRIFRNAFSRGETTLPINGLVWMGDKETMRSRIDQKVAEGFECIKVKIGAINFEDELELLRYIRETYSEHALTLRVDANGAFAPEEAVQKLEQLAKLDLHSIEQPIATGQLAKMHRLCRDTPLPIALDEELIGVEDVGEKAGLLDRVKPQYIILKPGLMGGLQSAMDWIGLANERGIGWWMTSALESNIGLNAIAQLTAQYPVTLPQGLGTGALFHNNVDSPLLVSKGQLQYQPDKEWGYSALAFGA